MFVLIIMAILAASITPGTYSLLAWYCERIHRKEMTHTVFSAFVLVGSFLYLLGLYLFPYIVESMGKGYLNESFNWAMAKFGLFVWIGVLIFIGLHRWVLNLFRWRRQKNSGERKRLLLQVFFLGISILLLLFNIIIPYFSEEGLVHFQNKEKRAFAGYVHFVEENLQQHNSFWAIQDWIKKKMGEETQGYECMSGDIGAMQLGLPIRYVSFKPSLLDMRVSCLDESGNFSDFDEKVSCVYIRIAMPWGDDKLFERGDNQGLIVFPQDGSLHPPLSYHEEARKDGRVWIHYIEPNAYVWREIYPYYLIEGIENLPERPITGNQNGFL